MDTAVSKSSPCWFECSARSILLSIWSFNIGGDANGCMYISYHYAIALSSMVSLEYPCRDSSKLQFM
jgi:hypothetical protein